MAIQNFTEPPEVTQVAPDKIDSMVLDIMSSLDVGIHAFQHASLMYNSDFFKNESLEFKASLCTALKAHFSQFPNSFWNKFSTS